VCRYQFIPLIGLTLVLGSVQARLAQAQWQVDGVPICTAVNDQYSPKIISDGTGGAIIVWQDERSGSDWDMYVARKP